MSLLESKSLLESESYSNRIRMTNEQVYLCLTETSRLSIFQKIWPCWLQTFWETILRSKVLVYFDVGSKANFYFILRDHW